VLCPAFLSELKNDRLPADSKQKTGFWQGQIVFSASGPVPLFFNKIIKKNLTLVVNGA